MVRFYEEMERTYEILRRSNERIRISLELLAHDVLRREPDGRDRPLVRRDKRSFTHLSVRYAEKLPKPRREERCGIRAAFTTYSRDDDPDWRSATWIKPDECSHLA
jgi:hypothetical protein